MPRKSVDSTSVRRSPRAPARVKVKFTKQTPEEAKKKSFSRYVEEQRIPVPVTPPAVAIESRKRKSGGKENDKYCWVCHELGDDQVCEICPRVFHHQCLNPNNRFSEDGSCFECNRQSLDGTELHDLLKANKLCELLMVVLSKLMQKAPPQFKTWPGSEEDNEKLFSVMDLNIMMDKLTIDRKYENTSEFWCDIRWILHNCTIFYGSSHQLTVKARSLVNAARNELIDLEACPECYARCIHIPNESSNEDHFTEVCNEPHTLVWAKMKGFPYWPAKVLKVIDNMANVHFFGTHDRGKISVSDSAKVPCYLLSQESPNKDKMPRASNFLLALDERERYIQNFVERCGRFQYASPKTVYKPGHTNHITKNIRTPVSSRFGLRGKRPRRNDAASGGPEKQHSTEIIDVEAENPQDTLTPQSDVQPVQFNNTMPQSKNSETLVVSPLSAPWSVQNHRENSNVGNMAIVGVHSISDRPNDVLQIDRSSDALQMDFCVDESADLSSNPSRLVGIEPQPEVTSQDIVQSIITELFNNVTENDSEIPVDLPLQNNIYSLQQPSADLSQESEMILPTTSDAQMVNLPTRREQTFVNNGVYARLPGQSNDHRASVYAGHDDGDVQIVEDLPHVMTLLEHEDVGQPGTSQINDFANCNLVNLPEVNRVLVRASQTTSNFSREVKKNMQSVVENVVSELMNGSYIKNLLNEITAVKEAKKKAEDELAQLKQDTSLIISDARERVTFFEKEKQTIVDQALKEFKKEKIWQQEEQKLAAQKELENAVEAARRELIDYHTKEMAELRHNHECEIEGLHDEAQARAQEELSESIKAFKDTIKDLEIKLKNNTQELNQLKIKNDELKSDITKSKKLQDTDFDKLKKKHELDIEKLKKKHDIEIEKNSKRWETKMDTIVNETKKMQWVRNNDFKQ